MRPLHRFNGGVHPPEHKDESRHTAIQVAPLPARLVVPLHQHIGNAAKPAVQAGDRVLKGQAIGRAEGGVSATVHAPTSGTVTGVDKHVVAHPSGLSDLCVVIEPDGRDEWIERQPLDYRSMEPAELRARLRESGVVGLGGAVFPTQVKLSPARHELDTLIINGAECEPWITCDDRLMRERAEEIVAGIRIIRHLLPAREVLIGIEDNKPEAVQAMEAACAGSGMAVVVVPTLYPSGGAKQLARLLTGKEVPADARSTDVGLQVFNVATAYALARFVHQGEPMVSRVVTVSGNVEQPGNYEVPLGMSIEDVVALGRPRSGTTGYIMGGPMMGLHLPSAQAPIVKATNCIIVKSAELFPARPPALPCIRCTACAQACPADLQPHELHWFIKGKDLGRAQEYNLFDCIECGCCSYVCPSNIPLVQYYRYAKSEIWAREKEKKAAERARTRHEDRQARLEREKAERAAKSAAAKAAADTGALDADAARKAAVQAALERARARQATVQPPPADTVGKE